MAVKDDYQDFKNALNDLKMNNKSLINFLTILAEDKIQSAPQIVRAIEERILEVCIKLFFLSKKKTINFFNFRVKVIMFYLHYMYLIQW